MIQPKRRRWSPGRFLDLVNTLALLSLKAEVSRLYLSYVWWLVEPVLYVLVFYVVFEVFFQEGRPHFMLFLLCGKVPFLWFARSVTVASDSILGNQGLIGQMDVPKILFPCVIVQEGLYRQWVVFVLLLIVALMYGMQPTVVWLWLLPIIFVQWLLIMCCGLLAALLVTYVPDTRLLINLAMTFLLFTSGIFYDVGSFANPVLSELLILGNPLAFLIICYRQVMMFGTPLDLTHLVLLGVFLLVCLLLLYLIYRLLDRRLATRVLT